MEEIIRDLQFIANKSLNNKDEFELFKRMVKTIPVTKFDEMAQPIVEKITAAIDCKQCGNCCRHQEPGVTNDEMEILAEKKNITVEDFKDKFIAWDKENVSFLCVKPCTFLVGNECSVYSSRPNSCADFPGLHRPRLKWRMKQMEENYSICPIVFNVVEQLKKLV